MARIVEIPTGVQNRRGADGSGFAVGKQTASGTPVTRVNYTSLASSTPHEAITSGNGEGDSVSFYLDGDSAAGNLNADGYNQGEGTITISITGTTTADADFVITGRDEDGNVQTETVTVALGANPSGTSTNNFAGIYLTTIEAPATLTPNTVTWAAVATTVANTVTDGIVPLLFPVSNLDMNEDADIQQSDLISGLGAATPPDIGQYSGHMNVTTGVLTENLPYLLAGIFNPVGGLSSTPVATQSAGAAIAVPADGSVPISVPSAGTTHPSKIKITFAAAPGAGTLTIQGWQKIGSKQSNRRSRREVITLGAGTTYESANYYIADTNNTLTITAAGVMTAGNAAFVLDPELHTMTFSIAQNDVQFPGWSVQGLVGGEPRAGYDVVPSLWNVNASPTGVSIDLQCPAGQVTRKRTIQGGELEEPFLDADYDDAAPQRYGGWAGAFSYGTQLVKMTNLAIAFNRNYDADEAVDANRFATDIEATGNRIITVAPTTRFQSSYEKNAAVNNWQDIFRDQTRTALEGRWYHYSGRGQRRQIIFSFPSSLIVESPQSTVGGAASIDEALSLQAFTQGSQTEMSVQLFLAESYSV